MEIVKKGNEIVVKHILKNSETFKFLKGGKFETFSVFKKPKKVIGISNITGDGYGIIFCDYDTVLDFSVVEEDFKLIQNLYQLPPAYIFSSSEGKYHLICLAKFSHAEVHEILQYTRIDSNYKTMPLRSSFRSYILRIGPKGKKDRPKFIKIIGETKNLDMEISSAHLDFLKKLYPNLPEIKYQNKDNLLQVKINTYETLN